MTQPASSATDHIFVSSPERKYVIEGGRPLRGEVHVAGAKNAINKQLVASLLTDEPCVFHNVPRIEEIDVVLDMLREVGTQHEWLDEDTLKVQTPEVVATGVSQRYSGFNRIPILMLSPLVYRAGEANVPTVGGCKIGPRPVDFHIEALGRMGIAVQEEGKSYRAIAGQVRGAHISLPYPSVGATENALVAAVVAEGMTVIENAAMEPEIVDTILFLQGMGALITVDVDRRIIVEGVKRLHGTTHRIIADRIEVASLGVAAVATNGRVRVRGAEQEHMISFLNTLRRAGGEFTIEDDGITFERGAGGLRAVHLDTDVHPGFMTDWQQPFVVLLTQAQGTSVIHETVYEERFGYTEALRRMGADIELAANCLGAKPCRFLHRDFAHSALVRGPIPLKGIDMAMPDLRAAFAYVIAGLIAEGVSEISAIRYIERGYANVPEKLASLGAAITVE